MRDSRIEQLLDDITLACNDIVVRNRDILNAGIELRKLVHMQQDQMGKAQPSPIRPGVYVVFRSPGDPANRYLVIQPDGDEMANIAHTKSGRVFHVKKSTLVPASEPK